MPQWNDDSAADLLGSADPGSQKSSFAASIKRRPVTLVERLEKHAETLSVSVMTAAELRFGAEKAGRAKLSELVDAHLERLAILDWTNEVSGHYARIRSELEPSGQPIGNMNIVTTGRAAHV
jgi:tRNA(fMet)-specific endonuclease VapC